MIHLGLKGAIHMLKKKIIFLVGPTAVGKTDVAVKLARKLKAEIISCDSMQIYRGLDIGTQKPSLKLRKATPHHMIDILPPSREFSAADFRKRALRLIKVIHSKGKIPLFVGGTGLYMKALIDGLFPSPPKDERLRRELYKQAKRLGSGYLHKKLKGIDPSAAEKIHPNDLKKIVRSLEICHTTGKTVTELKAQTKSLTDEFDIKIFGLIRPREELYRRIDERVDRMFEEGFLDEARKMSKKKLSFTASQAIGYREAFDYFKGKITLDEVKALIKKNTRHYAKRQLTWFRADKRVAWIPVKEEFEPLKLLNLLTF
jgi:tRNA dimethylallyltransferase